MRALLQLALALALLAPASCGADPLARRLEAIQLPPGFQIDVFAQNLPGARSMALGPGPVVFIGTRDEGAVYAAIGQDQDGRAQRTLTLLTGLDTPNGVAWRDGALYVAEISRVLRLDNVAQTLAGAKPRLKVAAAGLPAKRHHGWRYIAFGPDGLLYLGLGAPCNACLEKDGRFATIMRLDVNTGQAEVYAHGVRNSVGFDWRPGSGELFFTDNGRDWLGENTPPDELNRATARGLHFGFPFLHGKNVKDPDLGRGADPARFTPPALELGPHVAALGMRFYTGAMFPQGYRGQVFIAEHGSWNRRVPIGYRISLARFEPDGSLSYQPFASGWLEQGEAWGRPVDLLVMPDGALLVSDDKTGAIYRISHAQPRP